MSAHLRMIPIFLLIPSVFGLWSRQATSAEIQQKTRNRNDDVSKWVSCIRHDGFGSQYQCNMLAFAVARHDGECFAFTRFDQRGFHEGEGGRVGLQTGLKSDNCTDGPRRNIETATYLKQSGLVADDYWTDAVRNELRNLFLSAQDESKLSSTSLCEVAFHIRRGDVPKGARFIPIQSYYDAILTNFANKKVCVVSEGEPEDFGDLQSLQNVEFILTSDIEYAFHQLLLAQELVIAPSSFSYTAALLNKGQIWYMKVFLHDPLKDWRQVPLQNEHKGFRISAEQLGPTLPDEYEPLAASDFD